MKFPLLAQSDHLHFIPPQTEAGIVRTFEETGWLKSDHTNW